MEFSLVLDLLFNKHILDLYLDDGINQVVVIKLPVFENEIIEIIICMKIKIVITIRFTFYKMRIFLRSKNNPHLRF